MATTIQPILPPQDGLQRFWGLRNIFVGPNGSPEQAYVPNVGDMVQDWDTGFYRVTNVDDTTFLSTLVPWTPPAQAGGVAEEDQLLGAGPGTQSESYRVFHNGRVTPFTGEFDGRLRVYARRASYIKLFRGRDATGNGTVISAMYDQGGNFVSNNIPLELVQSASGNNLAIKAPTKFFMTQQLDAGESVTAIVYGNDDNPLSSSHLLIVDSENYMHGSAAVKYIQSISLESQFMAAGEENLVQMPLSLPAQSAMFRCVVHYTDGTTLTYPVDGTKVRMNGLGSYISSELGSRWPLELVYVLSPEENSANVQGNENYRFVARSYEIETVEAQNNYNVKLFTYPTWDVQLGKYVLRHFLTNLDREEMWDVTAATSMHVTSPAFDGLLYNSEQNMVFIVDLDQVDSIFSDFRHVIPQSINLLKAPGVAGAKWTARFGPDNVLYGVELIAEATDAGNGDFNFLLSSGYATQATWLQKVFYDTSPVRNPSNEAVAPEPTHFTLIADGVEVTRPVGDFDQPVPVATAGVPQGSSVYLRFEKHDGQDVSILGVSAMPVDNV